MKVVHLLSSRGHPWPKKSGAVERQFNRPGSERHEDSDEERPLHMGFGT